MFDRAARRHVFPTTERFQSTTMAGCINQNLSAPRNAAGENKNQFEVEIEFIAGKKLKEGGMRYVDSSKLWSWSDAKTQSMNRMARKTIG
jgi:hypothetical protein